jgi:hypothetical protein
MVTAFDFQKASEAEDHGGDHDQNRGNVQPRGAGVVHMSPPTMSAAASTAHAHRSNQLPRPAAHRQYLGRGRAGTTLRELMDRMGHASSAQRSSTPLARRPTRASPRPCELVVDGLQDVAKTADSESRTEASGT